MLSLKPSKPLSSIFITYIFFWKSSFDPNETMTMRRSTALPFVMVLEVLNLELWANNLVHEKGESSVEMVGSDIRVITNVLSRNLDSLSSYTIPLFIILGHMLL
jgi:hypothetical protein